MPEMAHDWLNKSILFYSILFTPNSKSSVSPLEFTNNIYTDEIDKASILNNFFQSKQTFLDDRNAVLPDLPPATVDSQLDHIVFTPYEVESIIKIMTIGKASGPNRGSKRILRELSEKSEIRDWFRLIF